MDPYIGEIRIFAGTFAPVGWWKCDGSLQPISQYETLYALIGTTFGGDGQTTFGLPDLRGRVPVGAGTSRTGAGTYQLGDVGGTEQVTLLTSSMPAHNHLLITSTVAGTGADPTGNVLAQAPDASQMYVAAATTTNTLNPGHIGAGGGSQPHDNMQPYTAINYVICYEGIYPSQP